MTSTSHGQRLRRADRLRSPKDFRRVQRHGVRRSNSNWVVQVARRRAGGLAPVALGLSVSRRVGNAVVRNRVKRRVREWFRRNRAALPPGADVVVIARRGAAHRQGPQLARELAQLVRVRPSVRP